MLEKIYDFLSSLRLSVMLSVTGAVYEIFLTAWAATSPAEKVAKIGKMSPFVILWSLLALNTVLCMTRRFQGYIREGRKGTGSLLLHSAVIAIALALLISHLFKFEGKFTLGLHENREITRKDYERAESSGLFDASPPPFRIEARSIDTAFWGNELLFTRFTSNLSLDGRERVIAINAPAFLSPFTTIRLTSFGYGIGYMVTVEGERAPVEERAVKLNIFPPGQTDAFRLDSFPHKFYVSLYPDYADDNGSPSSRSMRLDNPKLEMEFYRGKVFLGRTLLSPGERVKIEQFFIALTGVIPTAEYAVVYDPGFPVLIAGFLLGLVGLIMRVVGRKGAGE